MFLQEMFWWQVHLCPFDLLIEVAEAWKGLVPNSTLLLVKAISSVQTINSIRD